MEAGEPMASTPPQAASEEPFAAYLARVYRTARGYVPSTEPELEALRAGCDIVLTQADRKGFSIVCIVDAELEQNKQFWGERRDVVAAGNACRKYASGRKRVHIHIIEVGRGAYADPYHVKRLSPLRTVPHGAVQLDTWMVEPASRSVWTNRPLGLWSGLFGTMYSHALDTETADQRRVIAFALREPRVPAGAPISLPRVRRAPRLPYMTFGLAALLCAIYGVSVHLSGTREPGTLTLAALGADSRAVVVAGHEWWRLFTAPLLHANAEHIAGNVVALLWAGFFLECLVGRAWLLALFVLGAIGGELMSLAFAAVEFGSVGASGAITGLFAAAVVSSFRLPQGTSRRLMQLDLGRILLVAVTPFFLQRMSHVNYAAHLGGAIAGVAAALWLLRVWPRGAERPGGRKVARAISAAGVALFALGFVLVAKHYPTYAGSLIPDARMPQMDDALAASAADLAARWPKDPRGRWALGEVYMRDDDAPAAEQELRAALADLERLPAASMLSPMLEQNIRWSLASTLYSEGKADEAQQAARPLCDDDQVRESIRGGLKEHGLCP